MKESFKTNGSGTTLDFKVTDTSNNTLDIDAFIKEKNKTHPTIKTPPSDVFQMANLIDPKPTSRTVTPTSQNSQVSSYTELTYSSEAKPSSITLTPSAVAASSAVITLNSQDAVNAMKKINTLNKEYFVSGDKEVGVIGNIYVCLDFLYKLATSNQMEAQDSKEKQEINLYSYVKNIASGINAALGSVSNFEVHVDPVDNIGRIIDVNYCEPNKQAHSLHEFNIQSLDSVIRNFKLESKIFPNQSAIIAIGAQASGGQLGIQNNTMVDYNTTLTDRVLGNKTFPKKANALSQYKGKTSPDIAAGLSSLVFLLATLNTPIAAGSTSQLKDASSKAKNSLRDLIVYFQNITASPSANRNIIPTKLSFEMDGIGGLVIGQLFKIDPVILPKGYKGLKGELAQTITGINHNISNGDWKTNIDSLIVILDDVKSGFGDLDIASIVSAAVQTAITQGTTPAPGPTGTPPGPPPPPGSSKVTTVPVGKKDPLAGTVHRMRDQGLTDFIITHNSLNTGMTKKRSIFKIKQLVLHHTAGYGNAYETIKGMQDNSGHPSYWAGIHFAIDRGGGILYGAPLEYETNHADNYNPTSVGIEICNLGAMQPPQGNIWRPVLEKSNGRSFQQDATQTNPRNSPYVPYAYCPSMANLGRPSTWGGEIVDMQFKWQGYQYYEDYTDIQIAAVQSAIEEILSQCPNIKLNYDRGSFASIYYNVFGIKECKDGSFPKKGGSYVAERDRTGRIRPYRYDGTNSGIVIHGTSPKGDHKDTHPSSKMLDMLKKVNWPAKNLDPTIYK
jgi:hypothetical protein